MFLVCVRTVGSDTVSSRAMSGPSRSLSQEAQDLELAFAERLDQGLFGDAFALALPPSAASSRRT